MTPTVLWLIGGFVILGAEMLVGTIYLLTLSLAAFISAIFAYLDYSLTAQFYAAGITTCIGAVATFFLRAKLKGRHEKDSLDEGNTVQVQKINPDGSATVNYRGAKWTAVSETSETLTPDFYEIARIDGSRLVLRKKN